MTFKWLQLKSCYDLGLLPATNKKKLSLDRRAADF